MLSEIFYPVSNRAPLERPENIGRGVLDDAPCRFVGRNGFRVSLRQSLIERFVLFATRAAPNECFALLVGRLHEDDEGTRVVVEGAIFDPHADCGPGHVRTTPQSELRSHLLAEENYPDCIRLGWLHSHTGCGARFSMTDRENQRTWVEPHSLGIVVDPTNLPRIAIYRGPDAELLGPDRGSPEMTPRAKPAPTRPARRSVDRPALLDTDQAAGRAGPWWSLRSRAGVALLGLLTFAPMLVEALSLQRLHTRLRRLEQVEERVRRLERVLSERPSSAATTTVVPTSVPVEPAPVAESDSQAGLELKGAAAQPSQGVVQRAPGKKGTRRKDSR